MVVCPWIVTDRRLRTGRHGVSTERFVLVTGERRVHRSRRLGCFGDPPSLPGTTHSVLTHPDCPLPPLPVRVRTLLFYLFAVSPFLQLLSRHIPDRFGVTHSFSSSSIFRGFFQKTLHGKEFTNVLRGCEVESPCSVEFVPDFTTYVSQSGAFTCVYL